MSNWVWLWPFLPFLMSKPLPWKMKFLKEKESFTKVVHFGGMCFLTSISSKAQNLPISTNWEISNFNTHHPSSTHSFVSLWICFTSRSSETHLEWQSHFLTWSFNITFLNCFIYLFKIRSWLGHYRPPTCSPSHILLLTFGVFWLF